MPEFRAEVEQRFRALRDRVVTRLEELEGGAKFHRTAWERPGGGGGEMAELRGELFEKGGCNFSAVHGKSFPAAPPGPARAAPYEVGPPPLPDEIAGKPFFATGVSLVMHPKN